MGAGGEYTIKVHGVLDDAQIKAQLASLGKESGAIMNGGAKGKTGGMFTTIGKDAQKARKQVRLANGEIVTTQKTMSKAPKGANIYSNIGKSAKQATKQTGHFGKTMLDVGKKVTMFGAVTDVIRGVGTGIGAVVQNVFDLDSAMTEFKKVSDLSGKGLENYANQAYEAGRETAKTGVEMIDAATQFKKMGYDEQTSMQLATHATMFQNIADAEISAGDAAKFINSQMKAYQDEFSGFSTEGEKAAKVIDTVNEVANKNAVGTNDLQLALTKTSAAMGGFGNSFDQTVGIMTAGTEIMVGMPSQVARGWRTIAANILQVAQSSDEYTAASGKVKIATRDQNGEMKNTYEMMKDLYEGQEGVSKGWKELSKEEQSAIALELAGKNNMEKFRAVMDNFGTAIKATTDAQNSQGSAAKENARYLDSLEGKMQGLRSAWSRFANSLLKSDELKTAIGVLTGVLDVLASDAGQAFIEVGLSVGALAGAYKLLKAISDASAFKNIIKGALNVAETFGVSEKATGKFKNSLKLLNSTIGVGGFMALAAVAALIGYGMYDAYKQTHKYRREVDNLIKSNEENEKAVDDNAETAIVYARKLDELSGIENKTNAQKKQMAEYVKRLNKLYPDLNLKYDEEKDKLNKTTDAIREYIEAQREAAKAKVHEQGLEKATKKEVDLQEKRADVLKELEQAKKKYDEELKTGYVSPQTISRLNGAESAIKDLSKAYDKATQEVTKQSNNMLKDSGVWKELADEAKDAGVEISDGVKNGIDEGIYAIPKTVQGLENLNMFDDLASKLGVTNAGKGLVDALQQGMREGNLKPSEALKIAENFDQVQKDIGTEGQKAVEELSNAFANGEIDFGTFEKGMKKLTELKAKPKIEADDKDFKKKKKDVKKDTKDLDKTEGEVKVKADTQNADKKLKKIDKSGKKYSKKKYTSKLDADPSKAKKGTETATRSVETFSGKEAIAYLKEHGGEVVKATVDDVGNTILTMPDGKTVTITETGAKDGEKNVSGLDKIIKQTKGKSVNVKAGTSGKGAISSLQNIISGLHDKTVTVTVVTHKVPKHAKGTRNAPEGLSEVNEEGWEFIRDAKTGKLRIAGGGKRTVTVLGKGDAVYTHAESKRMLAKGDDIEIGQHKKGKKGRKKKKQTVYNKKYDAITSWYDNEVKKAEHTKEMKHYSDKWLADKKKALRTQAQNKLKALNKKKIKGKGKLKRRSALAQDLRFEQEESMEDALHDLATEAVENVIEGSVGTADDLNKALAEIAKQSAHLSAEERKEYEKDAYKAHLEYNLDIFKDNRDMLKDNQMTYATMRKQIDDYYKDGKITAKEYYDYLDDLLDAQLERETKVLEKRKEKNENTYDLAKSWIDRKIESLEKENDETEEQNELIEKQNDLEKARTQRVKVYRQGKGFVYEQDTQAIKEATDALKEYKKEEESEELKSWRKVSELFDQMEASAEIANLERLVGSSFESLFGGYGTNLGDWETWLKGSLSEKYGLENLLSDMEELQGWEAIQSFFKGDNATISPEQIAESIAKNSFATGTLSAPAGFAKVAENGYEIALLGKGDAVMPHGVSKNLMEWGQHSPSEFVSMSSGGDVMNYNFDKLVLPNVTDSNSFIRELHNLPNTALQYSRSRG